LEDPTGFADFNRTASGQTIPLLTPFFEVCFSILHPTPARVLSPSPSPIQSTHPNLCTLLSRLNPNHPNLTLQVTTGATCWTVDMSSLNIGLVNGSLVTLQIQYDGGDGSLYQCTDLILLDNYTVPSNETCTTSAAGAPITNGTVSSAVASASSSASAVSASAGASSGAATSASGSASASASASSGAASAAASSGAASGQAKRLGWLGVVAGLLGVAVL
jgi:hypothetical protein